MLTDDEQNPGFDNVAAICGQHVEFDTVTVIECDVEDVPTGSQSDTDAGDHSGKVPALAIHWTIVDRDPVIPRTRVDMEYPPNPVEEVVAIARTTHTIADRDPVIPRTRVDSVYPDPVKGVRRRFDGVVTAFGIDNDLIHSPERMSHSVSHDLHLALARLRDFDDVGPVVAGNAEDSALQPKNHGRTFPALKRLDPRSRNLAIDAVTTHATAR